GDVPPGAPGTADAAHARVPPPEASPRRSGAVSAGAGKAVCTTVLARGRLFAGAPVRRPNRAGRGSARATAGPGRLAPVPAPTAGSGRLAPVPARRVAPPPAR